MPRFHNTTHCHPVSDVLYILTLLRLLATTNTSVLESFSLSLLLIIQLFTSTQILRHPANCLLLFFWILQAVTGVHLPM